MSTFSALKKNRNKSLEKLKNKIERETSRKFNDDPNEDKFWYPKMDESGNAHAVIRFLPPHKDDEEDLTHIKEYKYGFKWPETNRWYIEKSLYTLGETDPVAEYVRDNDLWNKDRPTAQILKHKLKYISNIYVIEDKATPENVGKVFLFRYGPQVFNKIKDAMQPEFEDEEKFDPYNFWTGANFRLRIRQLNGFPNYEKSEFDSPSEFMDGDDDKLEEIWKQQYSLKELLDPSLFKSYDELKEKFERTLGMFGSTNTSAVRKTAEEKLEEEMDAELEITEDDVLTEVKDKNNIDMIDDFDLSEFDDLVAEED